jgi:hypothetical protein
MTSSILLALLYWSLGALSAEAQPFAYVTLFTNQASEDRVIVIDTATHTVVTNIIQKILADGKTHTIYRWNSSRYSSD